MSEVNETGRAMHLSANVRTILESAKTEGGALRLTGQLDRKDYMAVNAVLEALGGKWNKKAKAHIFECDADDALDQILLTGRVIVKKTVQQEYGFFPTPEQLARRVIEAAGISPGMLLLEPSAGRGALAALARDAGAEVECIEILTDNIAELERLGFVVAHGDFLLLDGNASYDRVVMNPPFAKQADIKHVTHALKFLKPGGRLVAIMSAGSTYRSDARAATFNALVEELGGRIELLPEGSFQDSGTMVSTLMLTIDAPQSEGSQS